ncbi:hypothetical protein ACFWP3_36870 [Streptomyces sp. NPDC058525]
MTLDAPETTATPWPRPQTGPELSEELLDRARIGWKRFIASIEGPSDG